MGKHDAKSSSSSAGKTPNPSKGSNQTDDATKLANDEEARRLAGEEEAKRLQAEEDAKRVAAEEEAKRLAAEEAQRVAAEEEAKRLAAEEEAKRIAAEEAAAKRRRETARPNARNADEIPARVSYIGKTLSDEVRDSAATIASKRGIDAYSKQPAGKITAADVFAVHEVRTKRQLVVVTTAGRKILVELT